MTTTTQTTCQEADKIVRWAEVREGDLILWDGELRSVERIAPYGRRDQGVWAVEFAGITGEVCIPVGTYAAVRRYVEAPSPETLREEITARLGAVHIGDVDPADGHLYPGARERIADAILAAFGMGEAHA